MKKRTVFTFLIAGLVMLVACAPRVAAPSPPPGGYAVTPALTGERQRLHLPGFGSVVYYQNEGANLTGRPLILTHSVNAAASAYEMKPIWDAYASSRPVYALEWPGFGSSDRPAVRYTKELMAQALLALVNQVGRDVDVVSLSLGSEFVARAALREPRIRTLALISPSGLGAPRGGTQRASSEDGGEKLYRQLNALSAPLYALIRSRWSIEYFLGRSFRGPVPKEMVDYAVQTSRAPGAKNAPLFFLSGQLFTADAYADLYSKLSVPTLVLFDQDAFVSFQRLPQFVGQPGVRAVRIPETDGLPQFEKMPEVRAELDAFWQDHP